MATWVQPRGIQRNAERNHCYLSSSLQVLRVLCAGAGALPLSDIWWLTARSPSALAVRLPSEDERQLLHSLICGIDMDPSEAGHLTFQLATAVHEVFCYPDDLNGEADAGTVLSFLVTGNKKPNSAPIRVRRTPACDCPASVPRVSGVSGFCDVGSTRQSPDLGLQEWVNAQSSPRRCPSCHVLGQVEAVPVNCVALQLLTEKRRPASIPFRFEVGTETFQLLATVAFCQRHWIATVGKQVYNDASVVPWHVDADIVSTSV